MPKNVTVVLPFTEQWAIRLLVNEGLKDHA